MHAQRNESTAGVVAVTKASPVVVRPSELELRTAATPVAAGDIVPLSSFDRRVPRMPVTSLLVFDRTIEEPVETIKRALSRGRALAYYRPIAGRLDGAGGSIACTDEGVTFVGAAASCALKEVTVALPELGDLAVSYPGLLCRDADPLLMVQVTEFACGGFVVAVTSNHVAADGVGTAQFLQAVGELARGISPPSRFPVRSWDESSSLPVSSSTIPTVKASMEHEPQQLAHLDIVVPPDLISRIRAGAFGSAGGGGDDERPCGTVLDAVMAVLWRCRTRATTSPGEDDAESPAPLMFACNMRAHAGAPAGYYGNCIRLQLVPATAAEVANSDLGHLVGLITRAKEEVPGLLSTSGGWAAAYQGQARPHWYATFTVTDWRNLGLDAVDFGGGPPERVLVRQARRAMVPGCVVCPPRRGRRHGYEYDGVVVSSTFVKPEHVDALLGELAALAASPE